MGDPILVDHAVLAAGGDGIQAVYRRLVGSLRELEARLAPMLGSWTGSARDAYDVHRRQWDAAAAELGELLGQMGRAVQDTHADYLAAARVNADAWSGR